MNLYKSSSLRLVCVLTAFLLSAISSMAADGYADKSVLASGKWVKIKVDESGMYQLSRSTLSGMGFSDISKVKIYGYGGAMISERMGDGYVDDLPQIPVYNDGSKIVFYAQGPVSWEDSGNSIVPVEHVRNPYSVSGYYFVTENDNENEFISTGEAVTDSGMPLITTTIATALHEEESYAPANTGRSLFGEDFKYRSTQTFRFDLPGKADNTAVGVRVNFFADMTSVGSVRVSSEGKQVASASISSTSTNDNYAIGALATCRGNVEGAGEQLELTLDFVPAGVVSFAYLDYIELNYRRKLRMDGDAVVFRSYSSNCRDSVFSIAGSNENTQVWDITERSCPMLVQTALNDSDLRFRQTSLGKREYVAFDPSWTFPVPEVEGHIANQNLHGEEAPTLLILSPAEFMQEAQRLADFHAEHDSMKVLVVDHRKVFNEFSSGTPDAMAYRKMAKMFWERTKSLPDSSNSKFRYMILFGRSLYDNRQLSSEGRTVRYPLLLTWESDNSTSQSTSYNSDDIFGALEDGATESGALCISLGRIPVKSVAEAGDVVDKIMNFVTDPDPGSWKNSVLMIADDGDAGIHMESSERAIVNMQNNGGESYFYNRVYIDAYERASEGTGNNSPEAREKMLRDFRNGTIYASYLGHGNPKSLSHNGLLRWDDIQNEFYYKHLPLFYTGTCEFTRWDDVEVSGGELLFLNTRGGVIGLITSSRATGISANGSLAEELGSQLFQPDKYGKMKRIGDILKDVKNSRLNVSDYGHRLKYVLIGDPVVKLKYPEYRIVVDEINGQNINGNDVYPEVMARQTVTLKGHLEDMAGDLVENMDGELQATVYDSQESVTTHGYHEGDKDTGKELTYEEWNNKLYQGVDSIVGGMFEVAFKVPKEINDNYRPGLINLYAYSESAGMEANGNTDRLYIYGYDDTDVDDTTGPEIRLLALNSEDFKDGDTVNETPFLIAQVYDESGINLSEAGIGHSMTLTIDGKTTISGLSDYYSQDAAQVGYINYQMGELEEGYHTLRLRVWDIEGNVGEKTIAFYVEKGLAPQLVKVYSDANPAKTEANFYVRHNRPDATITVTISVYTMMGQEVWSNTSTGRSDMYLSMPVTWNLTDGTGRRVNRGIYLYRATVSTDGVNESTMAQRIAVAGE